jgi:chromosome partitioning protein
MNVLAFVNEKGGCGKTTSSLNLAGALAVRGERTLLIDLDPQAHATLGLGCDPEPGATVADVLLERSSLSEALYSAPGGITLLPSSSQLVEFEEVAAREIAPERALQRALESSRQAGAPEFDFVLIDCPPRAGGVLAANALTVADTAVLVVESGAFALQGALKALRILDEIRTRPGRSFETRVLGTLFDRRTRFARELLVAMHARFGPRMYETVLRSSVKLREAAAAGVPVHAYDPGCPAVLDLDMIAAEIARDAAHSRGEKKVAARQR